MFYECLVQINLNKTVLMKDLVLVIDDYEIHSLAAEIMIKRQAFAKKVMTFSSAIDALAFLSSVKEVSAFPEVIFLDIQMPLMDGFEFLDEYIQLPASMRERCSIVLLSATQVPNDHVKMKLYAHHTRFFEKPLTREKLALLTSNAPMALQAS